jgi:hypothetical protein
MTATLSTFEELKKLKQITMSNDASGSTAASTSSSSSSQELTRYKSLAHKLKSLLEDAQAQLRTKSAQLDALTSSAAATTTSNDGSVSSTAASPVLNELISGDIRVLCRVSHAGSKSWALFAASDGRCDWRPEADVLAGFPGLSAAISECGICASPEEAASLRAAVIDAQDQLRVFRVRAEALLRQRGNELDALRQRAQQAEADRITGGGGGGGSPSMSLHRGNISGANVDENGNAIMIDGDSLSPPSWGVTESTNSSLNNSSNSNGGGGGGVNASLLRTNAELKDRDMKSRETIAQLTNEVQSLREKLSAQRNGGGMGGANETSSSGQQHETVASSVVAYKKLEEEYTAYRKRAIGIIKQKDDLAGKLSEEVASLRSARSTPRGASSGEGGGSGEGGIYGEKQGPLTPSGKSGGALLSSSSSSSSSTSFHAASPPSIAASEARLAYLRKLLVKYLSTNDASVRSSLEAALVAVAELTPTDVLAVRRAKEEASSNSYSGGLTSLISGIVGGGGGGGGGGASGGGGSSSQMMSPASSSRPSGRDHNSHLSFSLVSPR